MNVLKKKFQSRMFYMNSVFNSDRRVIFSCNEFTRKLPSRAMLPAFLAMWLVISSGCAAGRALRAVQVQEIGDSKVLYTLTLYHEAEYHGLKTIAFLVPEGNGYSLTPYAPEYDYTTIRNISSQEGLRLAIAFFSKNRDYTNYEVRRISDQGGKAVGFEIRPLYDATVEGRRDVMWVEYGLSNGGAVNVHIHLDQTSMEGSIR